MTENMREEGMKAEVYIKEEISSSFEQTLSEDEPGEHNSIEITEFKGKISFYEITNKIECPALRVDSQISDQTYDTHYLGPGGGGIFPSIWVFWG